MEHIIICSTLFLTATRNSNFFYIIAAAILALQIAILIYFEIKIETKPKINCKIIPIPFVHKTFSICPK